MYTVIVILVILLLGSYLLSKEDIFSPAVLTTGVWLVCFILFASLPHHLPDLKTQILLGSSIWCGGFVLGSLTMQSFKYSESRLTLAIGARDIYFWLSIVCVPLMFLFVMNALRHNIEEPIAMRLRLAALGSGDYRSDQEPYTPFYYLLWVTTYLLYLYDVDKTTWKRTTLMGLLVLSFGIVTMSKTLILNMGIMTMFMLYQKKILKFRHILLVGIVIVVGLFVLHSIRQAHYLDEDYISLVTEQYILRNFNAFDTLRPASSEHWGENVFRVFYAIGYKLHLTTTAPIDPILPWVHKPVSTNTYTTLYPFFKDFGYRGIAIFAPLLGALAGWCFKRHQDGNQYYTLLYAYFCTMLITQYNGDAFFTFISGNVKFIITLSIPFLIGGYQSKKAKNE